MKLQPGVEVTPNVRLESHLANGSMGAVWVAEHLTLNTKVAVKFISDERLDPNDPEVLERFLREASAAAQIKSSHVVQTFDQGVMRDGTPYIVMELLEGEELGDRLQRESMLPLRDVVNIIGQTAKALQMGHKQGVVHRDIKPDNIFLASRDDELLAKVFDFGIAKIKHQHRRDEDEADLTAQLSDQAQMGLTNDGVVLGTPEYMSPEAVLNARAVDHHADLWGLAVVAYVAVTGKLPFRGDDVGELCVSLLEANFVLPSELRPDVPLEMDRWFEKAFAKQVEDRFQTAREMALALALTLPTSLQGGEMALSGAWEARASMPSLHGANEPALTQSDSFSAAAADTEMPKQQRWESSTVGGLVAMLLVVAVVALFMFSAPGEDEQPSPASATSTDAAAMLSATSPPITREPSAASAEPASIASTASASAQPGTPPPARMPPRFKMPRQNRPRPKDPGF